MPWKISFSSSLNGGCVDPRNGLGILERTGNFCAIKTKRMHYLFSIYFNNQPLLVLGRFTAHHQEVLHCIYISWYMSCLYVEWLLAGSILLAASQTKTHDIYQLLYIHSSTSWRWAGIEVKYWNKLKVNSASGWLLLCIYITMHGPQNNFFSCRLSKHDSSVVQLVT